MPPLTYGVTGIGKKDYRVYAGLLDETVQTLYDNWVASQTETIGNLLLAGLAEVGECRADSVMQTVEEGDAVQGNVLGEIPISKNGNFSAELMNTTQANIEALEALDGKACCVLLVERDGRVIDGDTIKTYIAMNNMILKYTENNTGGANAIATIASQKSVARASAFRTLADITLA